MIDHAASNPAALLVDIRSRTSRTSRPGRPRRCRSRCRPTLRVWSAGARSRSSPPRCPCIGGDPVGERVRGRVQNCVDLHERVVTAVHRGLELGEDRRRGGRRICSAADLRARRARLWSGSGASPESSGSVVVGFGRFAGVGGLGCGGRGCFAGVGGLGCGSGAGVSLESAGSVVSGSAVSGASVVGAAAPPSSESVTSPPQAAATKAMLTTTASTKRSRMVMYVVLRPSVRTTK